MDDERVAGGQHREQILSAAGQLLDALAAEPAGEAGGEGPPQISAVQRIDRSARRSSRAQALAYALDLGSSGTMKRHNSLWSTRL
jgi:hypothetical protein